MRWRRTRWTPPPQPYRRRHRRAGRRREVARGGRGARGRLRPCVGRDENDETDPQHDQEGSDSSDLPHAHGAPVRIPLRSKRRTDGTGISSRRQGAFTLPTERARGVTESSRRTGERSRSLCASPSWPGEISPTRRRADPSASSIISPRARPPRARRDPVRRGAGGLADISRGRHRRPFLPVRHGASAAPAQRPGPRRRRRRRERHPVLLAVVATAARRMPGAPRPHRAVGPLLPQADRSVRLMLERRTMPPVHRHAQFITISPSTAADSSASASIRLVSTRSYWNRTRLQGGSPRYRNGCTWH